MKSIANYKNRIKSQEKGNSTRFGGIVAGILLLYCSSLCAPCFAQELTASWYSIQSLKDEGTYKYSKGVCADGSIFSDTALTAASCDYPLGSCVRVVALLSGKSVVVIITDRTNKRFKGKRIDLSKRAFSKLAPLKQGIIQVRVEKVR